MPDNNYKEPIELVLHAGKPSERVIVKFKEGLDRTPEFGEQSKIFEEEMRVVGIAIPLDFAENYPELKDSNRFRIFLNDQSFGRAFYEVYYPFCMNTTDFQWRSL